MFKSMLINVTSVVQVTPSYEVTPIRTENTIIVLNYGFSLNKSRQRIQQNSNYVTSHIVSQTTEFSLKYHQWLKTFSTMPKTIFDQSPPPPLGTH